MKASVRLVQTILSGLLILVFLVGCSGAAQPTAAPAVDAAPSDASVPATSNILDEIVKRGTIKIAIPEDTPLFGTLGTSGSYEGYDVDIANMLAKDLGVTVELVPVSSANRIPFLTSGKVDLVIANMGINPSVPW